MSQERQASDSGDGDPGEGPTLAAPSLTVPPFAAPEEQQQQQRVDLEVQEEEVQEPHQEDLDYGSLQHQHEALTSEGAGGPPLSVPVLPRPAPYESAWRISFLLLIALGPFICMLLFVSFLRNIAAAMLVMHWVCMLGFPAVYVHLASDGWAYYVHVYRCQGPPARRWRRQGPWALGALILGAIVLYSGFMVLSIFVRNLSSINLLKEIRERVLDRGLDCPLWASFSLGIYFILLNPLIEELFWRVFLYRELGAGLFGSAAAGLLNINEAQPLTLKIRIPWKASMGGTATEGGSVERESLGQGDPGGLKQFLGDLGGPVQNGGARADLESGGCFVAVPQQEFPTVAAAATGCVAGAVDGAVDPDRPSSSTSNNNCNISRRRGSRSRTIAYYDLKVPLLGLFALAAAYGSYHMVIFNSLMGPPYVIPAFILICILGGILLYLRNKERFGLFTAIGLHTGVDLGLVIVIAQALEFP